MNSNRAKLAEPEKQVDLAERAILIWHRDRQRGQRVLVACQACRQRGVRREMPLHDASSLIGDLPAVVRQHDAATDRRGLMAIADWLLLEISPLVAWETQPPRGHWAGLAYRHPEILLVNVTGIGDWLGNEQAILDNTAAGLQRQGYRAALAVADNAAAAWGQARFGRREQSRLPVGETAAAVGPLPPRALRLAPETAHQLQRLGIETIGQLRQLPRAGLATRLGSDLVRRLDQISGECRETLVMHHTEPEDRAVCELEYPTTDLAIVQNRLEQLVDQLAPRLAANLRGAVRLSCILELLEGRPVERIDVGFFAASADAAHWKKLLLTRLDNQRLPAMVSRIQLLVALTGPLQPFQTTLFSGVSTSHLASRQQLARLVETLANRLGRDAVVGVVATDHARPELAYQYQPLAGNPRNPLLTKRPSSPGQSGAHSSQPVKGSRRRSLPPDLGPSRRDPLRRPLVLYRYPLPINVKSIAQKPDRRYLSPAKDTSNHVFLAVFGELEVLILEHWGPERLECRSPHGNPWFRDYYRMEIADGRWFWIYQQGGMETAKKWYLHGRFG